MATIAIGDSPWFKGRPRFCFAQFFAVRSIPPMPFSPRFEFPALTVCMFFLALALGGCDFANTRAGLEMDGKTVVVKHNGHLVVSLPSNAGTGFRWAVVELPEDLLRREGTGEFVKDRVDQPGAAGVEELRFTVLRRGKGRLRLSYSRPWEHNVPAGKEVAFEIESR